MKSTEEIAESVFRRRDKYKRERRKQMKKIAFTLSCFCLVALLSIGVWQDGLVSNNAENNNSGVLSETSASDREMKIPAPKSEPTHKEPENTEKGMTPGQEKPQDETDNANDIDVELPGTDTPVQPVGGNTGELIAVDEIWGGSYMDQDGNWVILLTEDTPENRQKIFSLNPELTEDNTSFQTATYSHAYLQDLMKKLSSADFTLPACVSSIAFREELNRVVVYVTLEDADSMEKIRAVDSIGGAIDFQLLSGNVVPPEAQKGPMP